MTFQELHDVDARFPNRVRLKYAEKIQSEEIAKDFYAHDSVLEKMDFSIESYGFIAGAPLYTVSAIDESGREWIL